MIYSMWNAIKNLFNNPLPALMSKKNVLLITAYPKKGIVVVSYKGKAKRALFGDNTMRNMVKGVRFEENTVEFLSVIAQLLEKLIKK